MKCLLVAAFAFCTCALAHGQQTEPPKAQSIQKTEEVDPLSIPEPLFVLSEGGINKELSKDDLEKLNITQIASIEVITDEELTKAFGEKGKNGVLIICLKKD